LLEAGLNIRLKLLNVDSGSSLVSGLHHLSGWSIFGGFKGGILGLLLFFLNFSSLISFFLGNILLIFLLSLLELLSLSLTGLVLLLSKGLTGSGLFNHSSENTSGFMLFIKINSLGFLGCYESTS
jgi:hypothetical protein